MTSIAVLGTGQLGSRHLQSLASLDASVTLTAYDPSKKSLENARNLYNETITSSSPVCRFIQSMEDLPGSIDLVIVACNSRERFEVLRSLLNHSVVRYLILEKVLFPKLEQYDAAAELIGRSGTICWVNCNKRSNNNFFPQLKSRISGSLFSMHVSGCAWGLACNTIHFLDLFAYLSGCNDINLDIALLQEGFSSARRKSYVEFFGTLRGNSKTGNSISLTCFDSPPSPIFIEIFSPNLHCSMDFSSMMTVGLRESENDWQIRSEQHRQLYQSEHTRIIAKEILHSGTCSLPTFDVSARMHRTMIESFLSHMGFESDAECPIT